MCESAIHLLTTSEKISFTKHFQLFEAHQYTHWCLLNKMYYVLTAMSLRMQLDREHPCTVVFTY